MMASESNLVSTSERLRHIALRGRVAIAFAFGACALQFVLNLTGMSDYHFESGPNFDRSIGDRVCLVSDWMLLACLLVWAASAFRVHQSILFHERSSRVVPWAVGTFGLLLLYVGVQRLVRTPITGAEISFDQAWLCGAGWLSVWWCFVFRR